jgi:hypothetical protein
MGEIEMKRLLNLTLNVAAFSLLVTVGSSKAQTSSRPQVIELQSGETTKAVARWGPKQGRPLQRAKKSPPTIPKPHHHARGDDMLSAVAPDTKIVEADVPGDSKKENVVENKAKTFRAFTTNADGLERILCSTGWAMKSTTDRIRLMLFW